MLRRLTVENYALIERLDLELDSHLNIITGETGAGKSILLGALGLLLGNKNESGTLRDESRSCIIEGTFDVEGYGLEPIFEENDIDYEPQTVIRRMISASGKSRSFVNDMPVPLSVLRDLGVRLIDIHSQHRNMILSDEAFRTSALDTLAESVEQVGEYRTLYAELRAAEREAERMVAEAESLRKDEEWLRYQVEEFEAAALKEGELKEAESELSVLENADQIGEALTMVRNILDADEVGVLEQLASAENAVRYVSRNYPAGEEIAARLHSVVAELKDLGQLVADDSERIDANPERLQYLTERVNLIYSLCQKHRVQTLEELLLVQERLSAQLHAITHSDEALEHLQLAQRSPKDRLWALYYLAMCFLAKGQNDMAVMQLETARDAIPTMDDLKKKIVYQLGLCSETSGDLEKAYQYYKDVYSTDVGFADLSERMLNVAQALKAASAQ
jgi:DNA repair protein RecN (Recombination protein N)